LQTVAAVLPAGVSSSISSAGTMAAAAASSSLHWSKAAMFELVGWYSHSIAKSSCGDTTAVIASSAL
jgi:hypothetical protein